MPTTSGTTPNCASRKSGAHVVPVKNSHGLTSRKKSIAGMSSEMTMPDRREHGDRSRDEEDHVDELLAPPDLSSAAARQHPRSDSKAAAWRRHLRRRRPRASASCSSICSSAERNELSAPSAIDLERCRACT